MSPGARAEHRGARVPARGRGARARRRRLRTGRARRAPAGHARAGAAAAGLRHVSAADANGESPFALQRPFRTSTVLSALFSFTVIE